MKRYRTSVIVLSTLVLVGRVSGERGADLFGSVTALQQVSLPPCVLATLPSSNPAERICRYICSFTMAALDGTPLTTTNSMK